MPIKTECPACGTRMNFPETLAGRRGRCPKCGNVMVVPSPALASAIRSGPPPSPMPLGQTNGPGIGSIALGGLAFLISWIPLVGILGLPLSILGLILGCLGVFLAGRRKGGISLPLAGSAISLTALMAVLWIHYIIGSAIHSVTKATNPPGRWAEAVLRKDRPAQPSSSPLAPVRWTDAREGQALGAVRVWIPEVHINNVILQTYGSFSASDDFLKVSISIANLTETRKIDYHGWGITRRGHPEPQLADNFGNSYRMPRFGFGTRVQEQVEDTAIHPGESVTDLLLFEKPLTNVEYLTLELPGANVGDPGTFRLKIPASMVQPK